MELAPPSYEHSTLVDLWDIVARYMPSRDLTAAALVCSKWHSTFAPHIWGNPASHFGIENDKVYVALTRFGRNLQTARLLVRNLTHTLHMPPAHAEIYNGPHTDWLRDMLERLPNLQSLIVRGLPFFDHGALQALACSRKQVPNNDPPPGTFELPASSGTMYQSPSAALSSFGLRLLDASRCPNVTSTGLASALSRFEGLLYLDLSFTYPARNPAVLVTLRRFAGLQVLKLRGISLRDEGVEALCGSIGRHVRSLDIRDNELTDQSVRGLLYHCFAYQSQSVTHGGMTSGQRSPSLLPYLGSEMLEVYEGEDFEGYLRNAFTGRFVSRLAIEDSPPGGITHLYIAGNALTVEGLSGLVRSGRLHVLDAGTVMAEVTRKASMHGQDARSSLPFPGCEKLTPILAKHATESMTFLRIDHSLVTKEASHSEEVVPGRVELSDTALPDLPRHAVELESISFRAEAYEMATEQTTPRYELPGDPMQRLTSSIEEHTFHLPELIEPADNIRRGSAFAPEVVVDEVAEQMSRSTMLSPVSALDDTGSHSPAYDATPTGETEQPLLKTRPRSYSALATDRKARLAAHKAAGHNFHPAMLPHLTTLVLTDVPPFSEDREVAERIISFINNCAEEAKMARCEANLDYSLPPGRRGHASALRHSATKLFALKRLVLELAPAGRPSKSGSPWHHLESRSMTEDRDSESLWTAAETDFSFFGAEECVFPTIEAGRSSSQPGVNDKEVYLGQHLSPHTPATSKKPMIDNVALISGFRKERELTHQRKLAIGHEQAETEGFWEGVVQVVRHNNALRNDEELDYYGNTFTNNYLYR